MKILLSTAKRKDLTMLLIVIPPCISALYSNSPEALFALNDGLPDASTPHEPVPDESVIRLNNLVSLNP